MWDLDLERSLEVKSHTITPWCKVTGCYYRAVTGEYRGGDWLQRCKIGVKWLSPGQRLDCKIVFVCLLGWVYECEQSLCALFVYFSSIFFLVDPRFVGIHLIPESDNPEDDKIFLFFKENAMDGEHTGKATIARIGQLCKVTSHTTPQNCYNSVMWCQYDSVTQKSSILLIMCLSYQFISP